jgi:hypothetical protein
MTRLAPARAAQRCPYCGNRMAHRHNRTPTRDHICPRAWGGPDDADNIRIVCYRCNTDRALAGHCIGALACAQIVALSTGSTADQVLRCWKLPRPRKPGYWFFVSHVAHL